MYRCLLFIGIASFSCAHHTHGPNSIVVVHSQKEVDVWLEDATVFPGEKVNFYREECRFVGKSRPCKKTLTGRGTVQKILGESRYSVTLDDGSIFHEHASVEKSGTK
jgi:hypothetical protein